MTGTDFKAPSEFWIESRFDANLILVPRSQETIRRELPSSVPIGDDSFTAVQVALAQRRAKSASAPAAAVVLIAGSSLGSESILRLRQAIAPIPLLLYSETVDAYRRQLAQQEAMLARAAKARGP